MEKINKEVNESHRQLFANISKIYSDLSKNVTQSYLIGKKEAYEEVLNWLTNSTHNESKFISPIAFYNMITEKNVKSKIALAAKNEDEDIDIKSHNECKKKLHRMYISNNTESNSSDNSFVPVSMSNLLNSDSNGYSSDEMMNGNNNTNSNMFFGCNSGLKRKK